MEAQTERMMIQLNEETTPGTPPTLPVIDISPFVDAEKMKDVEARKQVAQQIHHACAEVGFFYITNHGVAPELVEGVLSMAREFFGQPVEEKEKISIYKHGVRCVHCLPPHPSRGGR
jgi:isopenicillin N synthase-like dioxygenase